jgi:hypothetical protein
LAAAALAATILMAAAVTSAGPALLPAHYAESVAVYALSANGGAEVRFRLARQPATGRGTLWMSMMVGGEHYALVDPAIELGPSATATPLTAAAAVFRVADEEAIEVAARDRQGDSMTGRVTVAAAMHATRHPPVGGGAIPITLEVDFAAAHAVQSPRPGRREVFGTARWRVTTPAAVFEGQGPAKWHEQSGPRPAFAPAFTYIWGAAPGIGLLARGGAGDDWGFVVEEGAVTAVDELIIDPFGADARQFTVRLADGRTVAGTATILRDSSVPIEGGRRPSATVQVDTALGTLIGHLNDWQPPQNADE